MQDTNTGHTQPSFNRLLSLRATGLLAPKRTQRILHGDPSVLSLPQLMHPLQGHTGCVNRLAWNKSGSLLLSGSDDCRIIIWQTPHTSPHEHHVLETPHHANIFGVKPLGDQCSHVVSGGMDSLVILHNPVSETAVRIHRDHSERVKAVEVDQNDENMYWSASEDGTVRQFDARDPRGRVLVHGGVRLEFKSLSLCQTRPHLLVVGASDSTIRIYDRRAIGQSTAQARHESAANRNSDSESNSSTNDNAHLRSVAIWSQRPPHSDHMSCTHVSFEPNGDSVLANFHNSHVYLFRISPVASVFEHVAGKELVGVPQQMQLDMRALSLQTKIARIQQAVLHCALLISKGNKLAKRRLHAGAIGMYSAGLVHVGVSTTTPSIVCCKAKPNPIVASEALAKALEEGDNGLGATAKQVIILGLLNRASILLKRGWSGDWAQALKDSEFVLKLDPLNEKAFRRRIQAYRAGKFLVAAKHFNSIFANQFPDSSFHTKFSRELDQIETDAGNGAAGSRRSRMFLAVRQAQAQQAESDNFSVDEPTTLGMSGTLSQSTSADGCSQTTAQMVDSDTTMQQRSVASVDYSSNDPDDSGDSNHEPPIDSDSDHNVGSDDSDESDNSDDSDDDMSSADQPSSTGSNSRENNPEPFTSKEIFDFAQVFAGARNFQTDIKESSFYGKDGKCIVAGSDDGYVYIWDRATGRLLNTFRADFDVVNCVQPNPQHNYLATSGIESNICLWSPSGTFPPCPDNFNAENSGAAITENEMHTIFSLRQHEGHDFTLNRELHGHSDADSDSDNADTHRAQNRRARQPAEFRAASGRKLNARIAQNQEVSVSHRWMLRALLRHLIRGNFPDL